MNSLVTNEDCMQLMSRYGDKHFDLAIVDPPYGIGENWKKDRYSKFYTHTTSYKNNGIPDAEYFRELFRVSKHQIVWGGNYYTDFLPARNGWIVWDKCRKFENSHMAEGELAWHSLNIPLRIITNKWNGFLRSEPRHGKHPHEKPVGLYKWQLMNYAQAGWKILDTHLGSGSHRIAAHDLGFDFVASERDPTYFADQEKRFQQHVNQKVLFPSYGQ